MILSVANSRPRNMQSIHVKDILPEPNANDVNVDSLAKFLEDYYTYMNLDGNPSREIASIIQNKDIDYATEKYLDEIELLIAKYTPQSNLIDRERLLKIINNYYTVRGTEEGTKLFFKLFYGEDISINYPGERVFNTSDGQGQYVNFSLKTITLDDGTKLDIKKYLNLENNTDRRVYGQYEYNDTLRVYENIGKNSPLEYSITQVGDNLRASSLNTYIGHNTIISGNGNIIAVADRKGNVKTYSYNSSTSLWTQFGQTLTGQVATTRAITFTDTVSNPDTITLNSHGLNNGDEVSFTTIVGTTGLDEERVYYVVNKTTNTFKISHTPGATPTTFVGDGSANLVVYKRFGHAMAFDYTGTKLLISEPGYSATGVSGRVLLYNYNSFTLQWDIAKLGDSATDKLINLEFLGKTSLGDDTAVFGHAVAMSSTGDSIAISSVNHTGGVNLDYVNAYKYKNNPPVYRDVTLNATDNTVTLNSHGFKTGDLVSFATTTDASAPVVDKKYYVINTTTNTFKISKKIDSGQIETATAVGTITSSGTALVTLTSSAIVGGAKVLNVPVAALVTKSGNVSSTDLTTTITGISSTAGLVVGGKLSKTTGTAGLGANPVITAVAANQITFTTTTPNSPGTITFNQLADTPNDWAEKVRVALADDSEIDLKFEIRGELDQITLVRRAISNGLYAAFDASLNLALTNGTCAGITPALKSTDVKDGVPVDFIMSGTASLRTYYSSWQAHGVFPLDENNLRAVSFIPGDDTISIQNHGLNNGDIVIFNIVRDVDGITAKRPYYVVNKTTHNFKIANTAGGVALTFNTVGTGTLLPQNTGLGKILNLVNGENFGWSLSYNSTGSRLAISTPDASVEKFGKCGKIDVYEYSGDLDSKWELLGNTSLYGTKSAGEKYGTSLTLSGDGNTLIGSAPYRAGTRRQGQINVGCVVSYSWKGQNWAALGRTHLYGSYVESLFGFKVATNFDGSRLAVSAPGREISFGDADIDTYSYIHLYEFNKQKDSWIQSWSTIENKMYDLYLGYSLCFDSSGKRLIYGIPHDIDPSKSVRNGVTFTQSAPLNNKPTYTNGAQTISYSNSRWKWINGASTEQANIGNEPYPWLAKWPSVPVTAFGPVGSAAVYDINIIDSSFRSDRTTKLGKIRQTIDGVQRDDWAIYDTFSEQVIGNYRHSYLTPPSGGINYDYAYSTIEYVNIADESDYEASSTEPVVTTYYNAALQTLTGTYDYNSNIITVIVENHGYSVGSLLRLNFAEDFVDGIFKVVSVSTTIKPNDTFVVANTTYSSTAITFTDSSNSVTFNNHGLSNGTKISFSQINSTTGITVNTDYYVANAGVDEFQLSLLPGGSVIELINDGTGSIIYKRKLGTGTVTILAAPPVHPYEVVSWIPNTTPQFNYTTPIVVDAEADDIRWVLSSRKGFLSEDNKIQDSYYYQIHSYEIKSQLQAVDWKDEFKGFCHPSGYELFSILEIIDFSKNNWVDYIEYIYGNRDYIPPRIRDLISKKESSKLLPTGLYEILTTFGGQHTPRSQPGRGIERDILLIIFVSMLDDLGKTYTLRNDAGGIVYTRNMVRMLYAYLAFHIDSKYIRGTNAEDMKFLGDDLDDTDNVLYKNTGKTAVYSYNTSTKTWSQLGQNLLGQRGNNGAELGDSFGYSVAMNESGTRVAAAMPYNDNDGDSNYSDDDDTDNDYRNDPTNLPDLKANIGCVNVYEYNSDLPTPAWTRLGNPIIGETAGDLSGWSISLNGEGTRVVIGAPGSGTDHGHVRVYEYSVGTQTWVKLGQDIDGGVANDKSGSSVAINLTGTRIAIGAPYADNGSSNSGSVKVYDYDTSTSQWIQVGATLTGEAAEDNFGSSLALNSVGNRLIVGAPKNGTLDAGHARVYEYIASSWTQLGVDIEGVTAPGQNTSWAKMVQEKTGNSIGLRDLTSGENFGWSVTINAEGNRVAIGAPYADFLSRYNRGYVRVYEYSSGAWNLLGETLEGELVEANGGWSLSLNGAGNRLVLGSPNHGGGLTKVYDYDATTNRWFQLGNDIYGDSFPYKNGWSVDINSNGDRIVVGESGSNSRTEIIDGQSLANGLLHHTPESYLQLTTGQTRSSILNIPTNVTKIKTTRIVPTLP